MNELNNKENIKNNRLNTVIEVPVLDEADLVNKDIRLYATGRRKEAVARLWLSLGKGLEVNKKSFKDYFFDNALVSYILAPLELVESKNTPLSVKIYSTVKGGGISAQAGALRLALARALNLFDPEFRSLLKSNGFLTRDARKKEREHYGFRTSRKPQQYKRR